MQTYKNIKLPISMNPDSYGRLIKRVKFWNSEMFILQNELGQSITIQKYESYNEVEFLKKWNKIS